MYRSSRLLTMGVLLVVISSPAWAQNGLMRGSVVDDSDAPLAGVRVSVTSEALTSYNKVLTTDAKGQFKLRFQASQAQYVFQFLFEKSGYQSFTQPISPTMVQRMNERFVMEQAETQVVESHGDLGSIVTGSSSAAVEAFNEGLTAQREGDLDVARVKFEEAVAEDSDLEPAHVALAQVLTDQGEHEAAVEASDRALALVAGADALVVKHQALRALGRNAEADAVAELMVAAEGDALSARRLYNEGGTAFQAGDQAAALDKFRQAAQLDPSLTDAHHAIASIELAQGNHEASAASAEKALTLGSEDVRTLRVLYDAYDALGRTDELAEIAPRLAAVDPDFGAPKLLEQAAAMWNGGQAERAVALARLALTMDPGLAKAYYFIGLDFLSKGENADARTALEKFIALAPDDPEASTAREMLSFIE